MWTIIFLLSTLSTFSPFSFCVVMTARGFVGQVDNVDARFKLVPDEVST